MYKIKLKHGDLIIDEEDFDKIKNYNWYSVEDCGNFYAYANTVSLNRKSTIKIHRLLTDAPAHLQVDHLNRNGLDNRKCNLRLVTNTQNQWNKKNNNRELPKGVSLTSNNNSNKFKVRIKYYNKEISLGTYDNLVEAAAVYQGAAILREKIFLNENKLINPKVGPLTDSDLNELEKEFSEHRKERDEMKKTYYSNNGNSDI